MKTAYKSIITTILVSLLVCCLSFSVTKAQAQTSYIIVHAHNPEGAEIASIQGVDQNIVGIYDGDTLIGYGAHDSATHNQPITISPGSHTIKVKFNGITLEQNINLNPYEIKALTLIFTRIEFDIFSTIVNTFSTNLFIDYSEEVNALTPPPAELRDEVWDKGIYQIRRLVYAQYASGIASGHASMFYDGYTFVSSGEAHCTMTAYSISYWGAIQSAVVCSGKLNPKSINIPEQSFSSWFIQKNINSVYPIISINSIPIVSSTDGLNICQVINANVLYSEISIKSYMGGIAEAMIHPMEFDAGKRSDDDYFTFSSGQLNYLKMSSVPYDLLGTGVGEGENQPPVASFIYSPEEPFLGEEITFDASPSYDPDGTIVSYEWDFGDGNTASDQVATHRYAQEGEYTVQLTVMDNDGLTGFSSQDITVMGQPPIASFMYSPEKPMVGGNITFDASSSYDPDGTIISYEWDFGDGNSGEREVITHTYTQSGEYIVTLTVTDNDGLTDTELATLEVRAKEFMITFDDGPLPGNTDSILRQLMEFKVGGVPVKAGFFMVGNPNILYYAPFDWEWIKGSVKKYSDAAVRVDGLDHFIGNHTQHHAWFAQWWVFGFNSISDFIEDEIFQCNVEIEKALRKNPPKIFRPPYLQHEDDPAIYKAVHEVAGELEFKIIGGSIGDSPYGFGGVEGSKKKAKAVLEKWKKDKPVVLIFHDNRPTTYEHIGEIISYLQEKGFTLVHFNPDRIGEEQKTTQAISGAAHSPVDLNIIDPDGLSLNKQMNQIEGSLYEEIDIDDDGELDDFFVIPEPKIGNYIISVIPEAGALSEDTYSLDVEDGEKLIVLAKDVSLSEIPEQPYLIQVASGGIQIITASIKIEPETLNIYSQGLLTAFITLPDNYDITNIDLGTVTCEGAPLIEGTVSGQDGRTYIAKFNREDLINVPIGDVVTLIVTGKVRSNGGLIDFMGADMIRVIAPPR